MSNKAVRFLLPIALAAALATGGCQVLWAFLEKMFPKEKVPAQFTLPEKKKVLVFVDDRENPLAYSPVKRMLTEKTGELLKGEKLVAETIPYDRLADLEAAERSKFYDMEVATVGRKLGADLVIYVLIDEFSLKDSPAETTWNGVFAARVRVVDVWKGLLWPTQPRGGYSVKTTEQEVQNLSEVFGQELARRLSDRLAEGIVALFCEHWVERSRPRESDQPQE